MKTVYVRLQFHLHYVRSTHLKCFVSQIKLETNLEFVLTEFWYEKLSIWLWPTLKQSYGQYAQTLAYINAYATNVYIIHFKE